MDELILEAGRGEAHYWRDLWRYRDLFTFLAWRDFIVRYKQTVFGVLWAVLRPFVTMVIFVVIFRRVANLPSQGLPYPIIVLGGLLPWQLFATVLENTGNSLVNNSHLITKIYFPRLILPASAAIVALVDFMINLAMLAAVMLCSGWPRPDSHGDECEIPRLSSADPVCRAVWALYFAGWLPLIADRGAAGVVRSTDLFAQSDGGCDRWLPLVHRRGA